MLIIMDMIWQFRYFSKPNQLKNAETKATDDKVKVKEEAFKRIVAELELVDQQKKVNEISDK